MHSLVFVEIDIWNFCHDNMSEHKPDPINVINVVILTQKPMGFVIKLHFSCSNYYLYNMYKYD